MMSVTALLFVAACLQSTLASAFLTIPASPAFLTPSRSNSLLFSSSTSSSTDDDVLQSTATESPSAAVAVDEIKAKLVRLCSSSSTTKPELRQVRDLVQQLEEQAELAGIGQASSSSGLLSGEWELLYAPEDDTRSSPFFWAFRKAFPENSDQIFGITDAIPEPLKVIGPAFQEIDWNAADNNNSNGSFVSRVKVATLGGLATSIMTTRASIVGAVGIDGMRLRVDTTKPEESTVIQTLLGPSLGGMVNENAPAFPSGEALERVMPGSSEVVMRTTFCDEGLRISRNDERPDDDLFVFRRKSFLESEVL